MLILLNIARKPFCVTFQQSLQCILFNISQGDSNSIELLLNLTLTNSFKRSRLYTFPISSPRTKSRSLLIG